MLFLVDVASVGGWNIFIMFHAMIYWWNRTHCWFFSVLESSIEHFCTRLLCICLLLVFSFLSRSLRNLIVVIFEFNVENHYAMDPTPSVLKSTINSKCQPACSTNPPPTVIDVSGFRLMFSSFSSTFRLLFLPATVERIKAIRTSIIEVRLSGGVWVGVLWSCAKSPNGVFLRLCLWILCHFMFALFKDVTICGELVGKSNILTYLHPMCPIID